MSSKSLNPTLTVTCKSCFIVHGGSLTTATAVLVRGNMATQDQKKLLTKSFEKAYAAFVQGDTDLARRLLLASCNHHTRVKSDSRDALRMFWCLAWFAFDERWYAQARKFFELIRAMEEGKNGTSPGRLAYLRFILAVCCESQNQFEDAEMHYQAALTILKTKCSVSMVVLGMIESCREQNLMRLQFNEAA